MEKQTVELALLLDFYGGLLTEKQRNYMELYYSEDFSLSEIARLNGITPQGVRDVIARGEATLREVERKTGLSTASIYRLMAAEEGFPHSVVLGPNTRAWVESEVDAWIEKRIAARDSGDDAELRAINRNIGKGRPCSRKGSQPAASVEDGGGAMRRAPRDGLVSQSRTVTP